MDTNNSNQEKIIYKIVTIKTDDQGKKKFCFSVPPIAFWGALFTICVVIGCLGGILVYSSNLVVDLGEEIVAESKRYVSLQDEYKAYQDQYKELEVQIEDLNSQITVLGETIAQAKAQDQERLEQAALDATPTGFPVTGAVEEGEAPEDAITFEPAIYLNGSEGAVVVATGSGTVSKVSQDAYGNTEVYIDHGNGFQSVYINDSPALIIQDTLVNRGTPLFLIGEENALVKYQITLDSALVDPYSVMVIEG